MADSIDRVFVHALNTVKRIRSARPPPADRLKLYGLYKQSMEGDVDTVMDRPRDEGDDVRSDQEKWDAWNFQKGLSRTEAKRLYIGTLIETMHRYASQTPDARDLVSELQFVWDQIKSNPPSSSSSSNSYPAHPGPALEDDAQLPGTAEGTSFLGMGRDAPLRVLSPSSALVAEEEEEARKDDNDDDNDIPPGATTPGPEIFVDASDSLDNYPVDDPNDDRDIHRSNPLFTSPSDSYPTGRHTHSPSLSHSPHPQPLAPHSQASLPAPSIPSNPPVPTTAVRKARDLQTAAGALISATAKYITNPSSRRPPKSPTSERRFAADEAAVKWQKRIEASLMKLTAELAALRETMQQQSSSSVVLSPRALLGPFRKASMQYPRPGEGGFMGVGRWILRVMVGFLGGVVRHLVVDAGILVVLVVWLRWRGVSVERVEEVVKGFVGWVRRRRLVMMLEGVRGRRGKCKWPVTAPAWASAVTFIPGRGR